MEMGTKGPCVAIHGVYGAAASECPSFAFKIVGQVETLQPVHASHLMDRYQEALLNGQDPTLWPGVQGRKLP